jgi:hypothetical protein
MDVVLSPEEPQGATATEGAMRNFQCAAKKMHLTGRAAAYKNEHVITWDPNWRQSGFVLRLADNGQKGKSRKLTCADVTPHGFWSRATIAERHNKEQCVDGIHKGEPRIDRYSFRDNSNLYP